MLAVHQLHLPLLPLYANYLVERENITMVVSMNTHGVSMRA